MRLLKGAFWTVAAVLLVYGGAVYLLAALVFGAYGPFGAAVALAVVAVAAYKFGFHEGSQRGVDPTARRLDP